MSENVQKIETFNSSLKDTDELLNDVSAMNRLFQFLIKGYHVVTIVPSTLNTFQFLIKGYSTVTMRTIMDGTSFNSSLKDT